MAHDPARPAVVVPPLISPLLDALCRDTAVAFACYGPDHRYLAVSRALADINGLSADEHVGRLPTEVLGVDLGAQVETAAGRVFAEGRAYREPEQRLGGEWKSGKGFRFLDSCWTPVRDESGAVVAALAVVNDVTDRHRIADLLGSTQWRIGKLQTVARELAGALTISEVRAAVAKLGQVTGSTHVDLRLLDPVGRSPWPTPLLPAPRRRLRERAQEERWEWRTLSWPALLAAAVRDGQPCYLSDRAALDLRYPEAAQWPASTAPGSAEQAWAVLPLSTAVGPVGGLYLVYDAPRGFDEDDQAYLQALAGQCTMAVARARMHEREHRQVVSLQEAILPKRLPELTGVDAAFRYIPGSLDTEVGGDWYDLFGFPDGRIGLVVGDVIGKGITAAAGMGRVRAALRALAFTDPSPRSVLTGLDRLFDATENAESLTTVVYAVLDPATRRLVLSDAGHLPLLVRTAAGAVSFLESDSAPAATPLGLSEQRVEFEVSLNEGDVVIGFSDGLVETREASLSEGFDRLLRAVDGAPAGDLDALLDHMVDEMLRDQEQDDDVTLLAVRIGG